MMVITRRVLAEFAEVECLINQSEQIVFGCVLLKIKAINSGYNTMRSVLQEAVPSSWRIAFMDNGDEYCIRFAL